MIGRTIYQPLIDFLAKESERDVTLTFDQIEAIIGRPLSVSALTDAGIWHATTQPQVRRWRAIGWHARFERRNRCVHFTREGGIGDAEG